MRRETSLSHLRHVGLVLLFFFFASTLYTYPLLFRLSTAVMVGAGDYLAESALIAWNAHQLLQNPLHLYDTWFFYPHSNTLAYGQSLFFPGLLAVPLWAITAEPLLVANILMFLALVLSGVFTYFLALSLTGRVAPSLLAGVIFSYFPNRMDHLGQFTVQMGFLLPLILWAFYRFLLERRWPDLLLTVLGIWAQILSTMYYGYALGFLLLGFFVSFFLLRPRQLSWPLMAKGAVGLFLLIAILAPFVKPYLDVRRDLGVERDVREADLYGMDLLSILDPGVFNKVYGGRLVSLDRPEGGLFPGFVVLGLLAAALLFRPRDQTEKDPPRWILYARRTLFVVTALSVAAIVLVPWTGSIKLHLGSIRLHKAGDLTHLVALLPLLGLAWIGLEGRRRRRGPLTPREWIIALLFLTVLMYLLTLTPTLTVRGKAWGIGPFTWVALYVPGGHAFRAPGRWALVFVLPLALLAAFGARTLGDRFRGRLASFLPGFLLLGTMAEYADFPLHWDRLPTTPPVYQWLARESGDFAVLEMPLVDTPQSWYMFWATKHWKRLVNGAAGFAPPTVQEIEEATAPLDLPAFMDAARSIFPLRYLVVHRPFVRGAERSRWEGLRSASVPGLKFVRSFDGDDVFAVSGTPQTGVDLRRYVSSDFLRRSPVAEYDLQLSGTDGKVKRWVEVSFNGRILRTLEAGGDGAIPLPAPHRAGDRNELRFLHRYELVQPIAGKNTYRIGRTSAYSPVDIQVVSAGNEHGNTSSIRINGTEMSPARRGYNLVTLDPREGRVMARENFDTFRAPDESRRMARFVENLPSETIVVASVMDDGSGDLTEEGVQALRSVGGWEDIRGRYRVSHLLVGVKGARPGEAVEAAGYRRLSASVGRDRPLAIILRSFNLR